MSEPQRGQAGGNMSLIAPAIASLLGRGAVIAKPVRLDDETEVRPVEIDAEAIQDLASEGLGKAS